MRANVYVDGFNLYHGLAELAAKTASPQPWKWLDLRALAARLAPNDTIEQVRYFTARVKAPRHDPDVRNRQWSYLRALALDPMLSIHYGQFTAHRKRMPLIAGTSSRVRLWAAGVALGGHTIKQHRHGGRSVRVLRTEEKGSDVNLATYLLVDAFGASPPEKAIVISNDTDLCEPIRIVVQRGVPVVVVNPRGHLQPAVELRKVATATRSLRFAPVAASQLPVTLTDAHGPFSRPPGWS